MRDVEEYLPPAVRRKLARIVRIRNKVVHDRVPVSDPDGFRKLCADAEQDLDLLRGLSMVRRSRAAAAMEETAPLTVENLSEILDSRLPTEKCARKEYQVLLANLNHHGIRMVRHLNRLLDLWLDVVLAEDQEHIRSQYDRETNPAPTFAVPPGYEWAEPYLPDGRDEWEEDIRRERERRESSTHDGLMMRILREHVGYRYIRTPETE
jgi:hypothetical protein